MKLIVIAIAAGILSACGFQVLDVKTKNGGVCFICAERPDRATLAGVTGAK
jgi:hypothetical protein